MNEYRLEGSIEPLLEDDIDVEDKEVLLDRIALHNALSPLKKIKLYYLYPLVIE